MTNTCDVTQDWHRADITAALHKRGHSMRALAIANGYSPTSLKNVMDRSWPKVERIVADAIGCEPEVIWPSRYAPVKSVTEVLAEVNRDLHECMTV
ncbi:helix-turn-helix domain-containing protein [Chitinibacter sp. S2-10]|uniref:helix-turn-helix domain-containing protein n=1 Tax=Chitinibacter sp. S2-10 TaxID=3373597 RepID=UPI003977D7DA